MQVECEEAGVVLPDDYNSTAFHLNPEMRPVIERGSAAMAALLKAETNS
jgi:hypothetical protein